ncbi:putative membrane protein [Paenibacillus endophyticus]|uniref:Putative membrane protein n=1 Tax=Paenibacillus endophyticus TaxID=1294268 RepID=A0A7W5CCY6_9BACL|nr:DUF2238 domain-containing protein [Paenibacillus endophyticus]MBB3155390.1 putative membrane protein [Paenibacillus endophyticus]
MTENQSKWTSTSIPFSQNKPLQFMTIVFILSFGLMAISPTNRSQWLANSSALIAVVLALVFTYKWFRFSNLSYLLMLVFFLLHMYAAHYTYEGTPFDHWLKISFHTKRSYYDRIVHFAFGLLITFPLLEVLKSKVKLSGAWTYVLPVVVVLSFSALFEILEMAAALVAGPSGEAKFVGLQGDVFDTHKDMALGLLGGVVFMCMLAWKWKRKQSTADH